MIEIARHLFVSGHVQGVFYRDWTVETARALGLRGWVRNRHDGRVQILAIGSTEQVYALAAKCRQGSPRSVVEDVIVEDAEMERVEGFERMKTA
jgi:acylphosphatase